MVICSQVTFFCPGKGTFFLQNPVIKKRIIILTCKKEALAFWVFLDGITIT